jgi:hypothetical protein
MKLRDYLKFTNKTLKKFCEENALNYGTMRLYSCGHARPSPEKAAEIEKATCGLVTRLELLYPEIEKPRRNNIMQ